MSNTVENLKTNAFISSIDYGTWNFKAEWYGVNPLIDITSTGNSLLFSPDGDTMNDAISVRISYSPISNVSLVDKELEDEEFSFLITDISDGPSNGYSELITNDSEGNLVFKTINYNKTGEYKYVITQIKGDSNHIYYDALKCYLTVISSDNGDGTMNVSYSYKYEGENKGFVNKYSVKEIYKDNNQVVDRIPSDKEVFINLNTNSFRVMLIVFVSVIASVLLIVSRKVNLRKFE